MASIDSYSESNYNGNYPLAEGLGAYALAHSITGDGRAIGRVRLYMSKTGSPSGNLTVSIFAHSGTFGTSSVPTGSALATSDVINASSLSGSLGLIEFTFSGGNQITLTNATKYVLVLNGSFAGSTNVPNWGIDGSSPTHGGNMAVKDSGGTWTADNAVDACFYVDVPAQTLSVGGGITPAGTVAKAVSAGKTGGITPAGVARKAVTRAVTGAITPAATVIKAVARALTGSLTPSGTVARVKSAVASLAGTITPTGVATFVRNYARTFTGTITPTGAVTFVKTLYRTLTGAITPSGAITNVKSPRLTVSPLTLTDFGSVTVGSYAP